MENKAKKIISIFIVCLLLLQLSPVSFAYSWEWLKEDSWYQEQDDPYASYLEDLYYGGAYTIFDKQDLKDAYDNWHNGQGLSDVYVIQNEIQIDDADYGTGGIFEGGWIPVPNFTGSLMGANDDCAICNLQINFSYEMISGDSSASYVNHNVGMFSNSNGATFYNVQLYDLSVNAKLYNNSSYSCNFVVGALVGNAVHTKISNCYISSSTTINADCFVTGSSTTLATVYVGGIAGKILATDAGVVGSESFIEESSCFASINICAYNRLGRVNLLAGGITARMDDSYIKKCSSGVTIAAKPLDAALQAKKPEWVGVDGAIAQSFIQTSNADTISYVGGIVGSAVLDVKSLTDSSFVDYCVFSGSISGTTYADYYTSSCYAGGIIGYSKLVNISNCAFTGTLESMSYTNGNLPSYVVLRDMSVGGIVGFLSNDSVPGTVTLKCENCASAGTITAKTRKNDSYSINRFCQIGGIAGDVRFGVDITNCVNASDISFIDVTESETALTFAGSSDVGGIVGVTEHYVTTNSNTISRCFNRGNINIQRGSYERTGGIVGYIINGNVDIFDCYNTGNITVANLSSDRRLGGIVGEAQTNSVNNTITRVYNIGSIISDVMSGTGYIYGSAASTDISQAYYVNGVTTIPSDTSTYYSGNITLTPIEKENATVSSNWVGLTSGNWKWSALYEYPILNSSPAIWGKALWAEPTAFRLTSYQYDYKTTYEIGETQNIWELLAVSAPLLYVTPHDNKPLLVSASSYNPQVVSVNGETITAVGSGKTNLSVVVKVAAANDTVTNLTLSAYAKTVLLPSGDKYQRTTEKITRIRPKTYYIDFKTNYAYSGFEAAATAVSVYENNALQNGYYSTVKTGKTSVRWGTSNESFCVVMGDCTGDGLANINDINKIQAITIGTETADNEYCLEAADVNGDGVVDGFDMALVDLYKSGYLSGDELLSRSAE